MSEYNMLFIKGVFIDTNIRFSRTANKSWWCCQGGPEYENDGEACQKITIEPLIESNMGMFQASIDL